MLLSPCEWRLPGPRLLPSWSLARPWGHFSALSGVAWPAYRGSEFTQLIASDSAIRVARPNFKIGSAPALINRYRLVRPIGYLARNSRIVKNLFNLLVLILACQLVLGFGHSGTCWRPPLYTLPKLRTTIEGTMSDSVHRKSRKAKA